MIKMIAACTSTGLIGQTNGQLPWKCQEDLDFFFEITRDKMVVMGNNTWKTLPKSAREKLSFVHVIDSTYGVKSNEEIKQILLDLNKIHGDVFVVGGRSLFEQVYPYVSEIYLTKISYLCLKSGLNPKDLVHFTLFSSILRNAIPDNIIKNTNECTIFRYNLEKFR